MQEFLWREEEKKWGYPVSYLNLIWIGENDKETGFHDDAFFSHFFFFSLFLLYFPPPSLSTSGCLREKQKWQRLLWKVQSVIWSKNFLAKDWLFLVVEEWERAPTQNSVSRKIVVNGEELCSCSTGRGQATNFLLSIAFLVFKELYVGQSQHSPICLLWGKNRLNTLILNDLKIQ